MKIIGERLLVRKFDEPKAEGYQAVAVQDSFIYKGVVEQIGEPMNWSLTTTGTYSGGESTIKIGSVVLFAKYSPDTQEVDIDGQKMKVISFFDVLAVL